MHSSRMRTVCNHSRLLWGVPAPRGCLLQGVPAPGGACSRRVGVSAPRGACSGGGASLGGLVTGGCLLLGGVIPACTEADPPCGQTDRCKNITFATSLRTVMTNRSISTARKLARAKSAGLFHFRRRCARLLASFWAGFVVFHTHSLKSNQFQETLKDEVTQ